MAGLVGGGAVSRLALWSVVQPTRLRTSASGGGGSVRASDDGVQNDVDVAHMYGSDLGVPRSKPAEHRAKSGCRCLSSKNARRAVSNAHMRVIHADGTVQKSNPDAGDPHASDSSLMGAWRADGAEVRGKLVGVTADRSSRQFAGRVEFAFALTVKGDTLEGNAKAKSSTPMGIAPGHPCVWERAAIACCHILDMMLSDEDLSERSRQAERRATEHPQRVATRR